MTGAARSRHRWQGTHTPETFKRLEGLLSKLRDTPPEHRPEATVYSYLATHFGVSVQTMQARISNARLYQLRDDEADYYLELVYMIGNELSESLVGKTFAIARDPTNRNAFNAQKWLLPKIDPDVFGESAGKTTTGGEASSLVSDVPQEVWDEISDEERTQMEEIEHTVSEALVKLEHLVRRVQQRVANKRAEDVRDLY
jgi:hypothetical protein